jgi:hypothetical protein
MSHKTTTATDGRRTNKGDQKLKQADFREEILAHLGQYDDGTGTVGVVVDVVLGARSPRAPRTRAAARAIAREIARELDEAVEYARSEREREAGHQ